MLLHLREKIVFFLVAGCAATSLFAAISTTSGCRCTSEPPAPAPPVPVRVAALPPIVASRPVATAASFDLVAIPDGAWLVYGAPVDEGGRVLAQRLGPRGEPRDVPKPVDVAPAPPTTIAPEAVELEAAVSTDRLAIVWNERNSLRYSIRHAIGNAKSVAFGPPAETGETFAPAPRGSRGTLTIANAPDGSFFALVREPDAPCTDDASSTCAYFRRLVLAAPGGDPGGIERMRVDQPCSRLLSSSLWTATTWFYGVCEHPPDGAPSSPSLTVYGVRPEPMYAEPFRYLTPGCEPLGLVNLAPTSHAPDFVVAFSRCRQDLRMTRVELARAGTQPPAVVQEKAVECEGDVPVLIGRNAARAELFRLGLTVLRSRIEHLLPYAIASDTARAVWTGESLLVADVTARDLFLRRYVCRAGRFQRDDIP